MGRKRKRSSNQNSSPFMSQKKSPKRTKFWVESCKGIQPNKKRKHVEGQGDGTVHSSLAVIITRSEVQDDFQALPGSPSPSSLTLSLEKVEPQPQRITEQRKGGNDESPTRISKSSVDVTVPNPQITPEKIESSSPNNNNLHNTENKLNSDTIHSNNCESTVNPKPKSEMNTEKNHPKDDPTNHNQSEKRKDSNTNNNNAIVKSNQPFIQVIRAPSAIRNRKNNVSD